MSLNLQKDWICEKIDANGVRTVYPPEPDDDKKPQCTNCGKRTQFLHFSFELLDGLKPDDEVPKLCENCWSWLRTKKQVSN